MVITFVTCSPWSHRKLPFKREGSTQTLAPPLSRCTLAHLAGVAAAETLSGILLPMALPDGFEWTTRSASEVGAPLTVIACGGVWVVSMTQRVDDHQWLAALDRHRHGPGGPVRMCSSYEQGRIGAELWVNRHEGRLREDVALINGRRQAIRGNRLAKANSDDPFDWLG
jgi:hypothetical protein